MAATLSNGGSPQDQWEVPATLYDAHEVLWRHRPARDADPLTWVEFHRHGATVYSEVAKVDLRHRHEATQCAGMEIRKARHRTPFEPGHRW